MADEVSPEEQAALAAKMKATPPANIDPALQAYIDAQLAESGAKLTAAIAAQQAAEQRAADAEERARAAAEAQRTGLIRGARQIPIWHTLSNEVAQAASGQLQSVVDEINKAYADVAGFVKLSVGSLLELNGEHLDAEAKARGFSGARFATKDDNGDLHTGYHLFGGQHLLVGTRDASAKKVA